MKNREDNPYSYPLTRTYGAPSLLVGEGGQSLRDGTGEGGLSKLSYARAHHRVLSSFEHHPWP